MKFSIVIPSYQVEAYIEDCLESLKRQTFPDFEAIVVDDASTDATLERAQHCVEGDDRFRFFVQDENKGQSAARNRGLERAAGEFILFLDSDDYYRDDALQLVFERLEAEGLDQFFFGAKTFYENRRLRRARYEDQETRAAIEGVMAGPDLYLAFEKTESFRPSACLFATRRSLIEGAGLRFKEGILHEDLLFTLQAVLLSERASFEYLPLYRRRMREGSTMTADFSMRNVDGLFQVAQTLRAWLDAHVDERPLDFRDAFGARIFHTYGIAARYLFEIAESEVQAYRDGLGALDRIDFELHVLGLHRALKDVYDEMEGSRTYRLGRLFLAFPSWVKSRLVMPQAPARDEE